MQENNLTNNVFEPEKLNDAQDTVAASNLEKLVEPYTDIIEGVEVTRYGELTNRVMIMAFGAQDEFTDKLSKVMAIICVSKGYELIRYNGSDIGELDLIYAGIRKESVFEEVLGVKKKLSLSSGSYDKKLVDKKFVYVTALAQMCETLIDAMQDKTINRFYFISPDFDNVINRKSFKWTAETEILISEGDAKSAKKNAAVFARRYMAHLTTQKGESEFRGEGNLIAIDEWFNGEREKKYGNNLNLLVWAAGGMIIGYMLDLLVIKGSYNSNMPLGMVVGILLGVLLEEIWRRR